jgi:primosomal protein N''
LAGGQDDDVHRAMMEDVRRAANRSTGVRACRLAAIALLALAAACSTLKLGYDNADSLLAFALDSYFDLDDEQEQLARERARTIVAWHRATQLRDYVELIEAAGRRIETSVSVDEVLGYYAEMNRRLVAIGARSAPELALLALTLTPSQIEYFAEKLAQDNAKARRQLARNAGRDALDARVKAGVERAKEWFGTVTPEQERLIRTTLAQRAGNHAWWIAERERQQRELIALLQRIVAERPPPALAARWFEEYFARLAEPADPERHAQLQRFRLGNAELIAQLINSASPAQKAALLKKLRGYADDFTTLAAAAPRG